MSYISQFFSTILEASESKIRIKLSELKHFLAQYCGLGVQASKVLLVNKKKKTWVGVPVSHFLFMNMLKLWVGVRASHFLSVNTNKLWNRVWASHSLSVNKNKIVGFGFHHFNFCP